MKENIVNKLLNKVDPILVIQRSALFDRKWYSQEYKVKRSNAAKHYFEIGYKQGNNPSKDFDNDLYIEMYPNILDMNPLLHYELYGKSENRIYKHLDSVSAVYDVNELLSNISTKNKNVIYIDLLLSKDAKSGAKDFSIEKINELMKNNNVLLLEYGQWTNKWQISVNNKYICEFNINNLKKLIEDLNVKELYINNLAYNSKIEDNIALIIDAKRNKEFKLNYYFHDYLCVCPSSFLMNSDNNPCNRYLGDTCNKCLENNKNSIIRRNNIVKWRRIFEDLFDVVDEFVFFSNYTKDIISSVYKQTLNGIVVEHKALLADDAEKYIKPNKDKTIRIAFVGNYCIPKGALLFEKTINLLKIKYRIETYIIGYSSIPVPKEFIIKGKYERNDLGKILTQNKINVVIYPSIDNETFSYVVQELMLLNVPFTLFDCGAPAERVIDKKYELAEIAKEINAQSMCEAVGKLIGKIWV